jgi:hypothetical protein
LIGEFLADRIAVVSVALSVDRRLRRVVPRKLIASVRARGATCVRRDPAARARLRRAIRFVDRLFPSGPNCYRRVLMEIALDAGAAAEPIHMGLQADGRPKSGHIWLESAPDGAGRYDAEVVA